MTMTINAEVIVDHVVAVEVVVVAMITAVVVVDAVAVAVEEAAAEMVDHGAEIEIAVDVVVEALQVYHVFMIHPHHAVAEEVHGAQIDLHLEWNDVNHHHHLENLQHAVAVVEDGEMHLLQQVAPAVVVGAVPLQENHLQVVLVVVGVEVHLENLRLAAPDGVVVAVEHLGNHLLIEVNHLVVAVVDGDHLQSHLDQRHGDHQPKNLKKKKVKVGEVQMLQLPVPNLQVVGKTYLNHHYRRFHFGHNDAKPIFCILYLPIDLISSIFRCLQLFYMSINKLYLIFQSFCSLLHAYSANILDQKSFGRILKRVS